MQKTTNTVISNIDVLLGDRESRFFSWGYKKVIHKIENLVLDSLNNVSEARGIASYPKDWSKKTETSELKPHLSTFDGAIFSIQLSVAFINWKYNLDLYQQSHTWIRKVVMKSGSLAQFDLENLSITSELVSTIHTPDSLCGYLSTFKVSVGNMKIELILDHYKNTINDEVGRFKTLEDIFGNVKDTYFGGVYRESSHEIIDIEIDLENQSLSSLVKINYFDRERINKGVSWIYLPYLTCLDTFVCFAQQMQALFYELDTINRDCSNNLWMREVYYESKEPIYKPNGYRQTVKLKRTRIIEKSNFKWRMADIECSVDNQPNSLYVRANIAHQLPS
jgi:hypothetical protein